MKYVNQSGTWKYNGAEMARFEYRLCKKYHYESTLVELPSKKYLVHVAYSKQ